MLTPEQQQAAHAEGSVAVTAGAGSGKTFLLTERYLFLVGRGLSPLEVVATTFTRKAAAELRSRIRTRLSSLGHVSPERLAELEAAQISTIDALAARICRDFPLEAGLPADFRVMDENEEKLFRLGVFGEAMASVPPWCFEQISYTELRAFVEELLFDPLTADVALSKGQEDWATLAEATRESTCRDLLAALAPHKATLCIPGPEGDAREDARKLALRCLKTLESGDSEACQSAYEEALMLNLRGGSRKKWGEDAFTEAGIAISALREGVKRNYKQLTLDLSDADAQLASHLPALRTAFEHVEHFMSERRKEVRCVDFANLEVHALKALEHAHVRAHYRARWKAFLVDELQDTNPVQERFLSLLAENSLLTVVGDPKQSIYGFRRADVEVFFRFRERVQQGGGEVVSLDTSFRTHDALLTPLNDLTTFLGDLHEPLSASRQCAPGRGPYLEAYTLEEPSRLRSERLEQEARLIALRVRALLDRQVLVHDGEVERPVEPKDIAVLARHKAPLSVYAEALAEAGVPFLQGDTDDLLATREAQDGTALLRFLADPNDDLALLTLLRSPFFALSDRDLQTIAAVKTDEQSWWALVQASESPYLEDAKATLLELTERRKRLPTELFDLAEKRTGYRAVIANLAGGDRRLADYAAFVALVRRSEADTHSAFSVWRELKLLKHEVSLARPPLAAADAVTLLNVHKAKGLEWPVVIVADLSNPFRKRSDPLLFGDIGLGLKLDKKTPNKRNPVVYEALQGAKHKRELVEEKRLLYVALTRARDYLILTSSEPQDEGAASAGGLLACQFRPVPQSKLT